MQSRSLHTYRAQQGGGGMGGGVYAGSGPGMGVASGEGGVLLGQPEEEEEEEEEEESEDEPEFAGDASRNPVVELLLSQKTFFYDIESLLSHSNPDLRRYASKIYTTWLGDCDAYNPSLTDPVFSTRHQLPPAEQFSFPLPPPSTAQPPLPLPLHASPPSQPPSSFPSTHFPSSTVPPSSTQIYSSPYTITSTSTHTPSVPTPSPYADILPSADQQDALLHQHIQNLTTLAVPLPTPQPSSQRPSISSYLATNAPQFHP